ncbi:PTR2-domain-containing protein [Hesseltinella vesiculosa]|uniref:PTR2-domain-containing protein n=1 Tax=Hesseltinella vesiculosa TaxID=101127 RepID=A0A1X2GQ46_9FUNG|nr:PTR2-domain-containing protein [Hesseltinella vesiculosa]
MSTSVEQKVEVTETQEIVLNEKREYTEAVHSAVDEEHIAPTEEDWKTLPEVGDRIPLSAFLVVLIEFCERFTYYGLNGPFQNYLQQPLPDGFPAGNNPNGQPGALNKGQQTATALTTFFSFWCYITPIGGAIIADQYLGKYKTIVLFAVIYMVGLLILTLTSIPSAIANGSAFGGYIAAILIIGLGTGGIKANVSTLVAEQVQTRTPFVRTKKNGKRVIVTPQATYQQLFNMFYWGINAGSLSAIATTELEKNVGFWSAYLLPLCMFVPCLCIIIFGRKIYIQTPPRGSVIVEAAKVIYYSWKVPGGFEGTKPSNLVTSSPDLAAKATWDDVFVDELRRGLKACGIFCWFPLYWLCYSQMTNNLTSMAATMNTGNVPNDIIQNIDPLVLIIFIPIMDRLVYPFFRSIGFPLRPIFRITIGFLFAAAAMAYTAGIQALVYKSPPFYEYPSEGDTPNDISGGYIVISYALIALSEIFASITGLEYAYKKAPQSMKSIVMSLFLFSSAVSNILQFALVSVNFDPKLVWMYSGIAIAAFICAILIWIFHGNNDKTDVEQDAIGRDKEELDKYQQHKANVSEYEAEKGPL